MTRDETRNAIRVMQAFVDGKEVQHLGKKWNPGELLKPDWCDTHEPLWNWEHYDYRIKPTAKLRPWTADEVPLGAWMRFKNMNVTRSMIVSVAALDMGIAFKTHEHSTDGGKTWLPCGVVEEAK